MEPILALGFVLGMRHALEADHIAAVAALAAHGETTRTVVLQGTVWGLGHTLTLFLACSAVLFFGVTLSDAFSRGLETTVGAMLILLGADVVRRALRDRVRIPGRAEGRRFPARALCVGLVHGLAGSAALIPLALATGAAPSSGLLYVALFGIGSIGGMAVLSLAIGFPLRSARGFSVLLGAMQAAIGAATIVIGGALVYENLLRGAT